MKAIAFNLGNGKERIEVDGEIFLESVQVGRWSHIVKIIPIHVENDFVMAPTMSKHPTLKSAESTKGRLVRGAKIQSKEIAEVER